MELTEALIRPQIIVEYIDKRGQTLRNVDVHFQVDNMTTHCINTVQGVSTVADSAGYLCLRTLLDPNRPGCCDTTQAFQYVCGRCDLIAPHCCDRYEHCVSCCMSPLHVRCIVWIR